MRKQVVSYRILTMIFIFASLYISTYAQTVQDIIKEKLEDGVIKVDGIKLYDQDSTPLFYKERNYEPIWSDKKNRNDMIMILKSSFEEGLIPEDYHLKKINELTDKTQTRNNSREIDAKLDLLLSDAMVIYARHLIWGKVDQSVIRDDWDLPKPPRPPDIDKTFAESIENQTLPKLFKQLSPQHFMYYHLKEGLKKYREIDSSGG